MSLSHAGTPIVLSTSGLVSGTVAATWTLPTATFQWLVDFSRFHQANLVIGFSCALGGASASSSFRIYGGGTVNTADGTILYEDSFEVSAPGAEPDQRGSMVTIAMPYTDVQLIKIAGNRNAGTSTVIGQPTIILRGAP